MLNVPALLAVLVSIPVQAYYGGVAWGALGAWLLVHCGLSLFFLALGLLCAMVTGWLLAIPAIYAVVNFAVIAAAGLVRTLCGLFLLWLRRGRRLRALCLLADARGEPREALRAPAAWSAATRRRTRGRCSSRRTRCTPLGSTRLSARRCWR